VSIRRIGLVVHEGKPAARGASESVRSWAGERGVQTVIVDVWKDEGRRTSAAEAETAGNPDLIVTIGGDGTFLRGARVARSIDAAVLGVDVGRVGFLTEVRVEELTAALDAVHRGLAIIEERLTLTMWSSCALEIPEGLEGLLKYGRGPLLPSPPVRAGDPDEVGWGVGLDVMALNDVVFEKLARDRQASLGIFVAGRLFASYSADAVIVSSPTGSTAYSFAAGGPVLSPRVEALVFTPVAPHMIFDRSLVVAADESIGVRVLGHSGQVAMSVDGQLRGVLDPGDWVAVFAAPRRARLVRLHRSDFFARLRDRFALADAAAAVADDTDSLQVYRSDQALPDELSHLYHPALLDDPRPPA
jgi:NAD+ kinase